jgi:hypothetical protein
MKVPEWLETPIEVFLSAFAVVMALGLGTLIIGILIYIVIKLFGR